MLTKYENGAEVEVTEVARYENGAEVEAEGVYAYKNGAEELVWSGASYPMLYCVVDGTVESGYNKSTLDSQVTFYEDCTGSLYILTDGTDFSNPTISFDWSLETDNLKASAFRFVGMEADGTTVANWANIESYIGTNSYAVLNGSYEGTLSGTYSRIGLQVLNVSGCSGTLTISNLYIDGQQYVVSA